MPSYKCQYDGCLITSNNEILHRFPKDSERCLLWVEACNNHKLAGISSDILYNKYCICGKHFQQWCFMNSTDKKRLVHNAVPNKAILDQLNENVALNTQLCNDDDDDNS